MAEFAYKGRSARGELISGRTTGSSADAVASKLIYTGVTPVEIRDTSETTTMTVGELWRRLGGGQPSPKDLILFCRQMYTITRTGLPLLKGMQGLMETTHNEVLRAALVDVIASLESGRVLSRSFARHPRIFSPLFVSIVEIGEATGTLEKSFLRMYEYLSTDQDIRSRVKSAIRYPIIVVIAIAAALAIITMFVIPAFAPIFRALGDQVPLPTKIIMGVSDFAANEWPLALLMIAAGVMGIRSWLKTASGRMRWDRMKLRIPVVGVIMSNAALARVTRSLAVALEAGLPINETLRTISDSIGNVWLAEKLKSLNAGVERGESLSSVARSTTLFTPLVLQMIALGEETGALPELLDESADYYKREVDYDLENLSAALEPILIVAVGAMVLILALGVFLPMWDMVARARAG
ncbi:MAG: type II secretion system F family protein [Woeseiaceae bacterium]|nr:type II secretion system F family protein [Woeseiaceae bacterium]